MRDSSFGFVVTAQNVRDH